MPDSLSSAEVERMLPCLTLSVADVEDPVVGRMMQPGKGRLLPDGGWLSERLVSVVG
jgi:hypothetical protein